MSSCKDLVFGASLAQIDSEKMSYSLSPTSPYHLCSLVLTMLHQVRTSELCTFATCAQIGADTSNMKDIRDDTLSNCTGSVAGSL